MAKSVDWYDYDNEELISNPKKGCEIQVNTDVGWVNALYMESERGLIVVHYGNSAECLITALVSPDSIRPLDCDNGASKPIGFSMLANAPLRGR